MKIEVHQSS